TFRADRDASVFDNLEKATHTGLWWPDSDAFKAVLDGMAEACAQYESNAIDGDAAADRIIRLVRESEAVSPGFGWKDGNRRFIYPDRRQMAAFLDWAAASPLPGLSTLGRECLQALRKAGLVPAPAAGSR
ncbi:FAD-dependent oxidoreductase, partial [Streptomyces sp. NPDC004647]